MYTPVIDEVARTGRIKLFRDHKVEAIFVEICLFSSFYQYFPMIILFQSWRSHSKTAFWGF